MKRIILVLIMVISGLLLTSCQNPNYGSQVTFNDPTSMSLLRYEDTIPYSVYGRFQPEGLFTKNEISITDDDIEFYLMHIYNENFTNSTRISSYGISLKSNVDLQVNVLYEDKIIFSFDFNPISTFEYKQTIPNNQFVGVEDGDSVSVQIIQLYSEFTGETIFTDTFTFYDNYLPSSQDLESYQTYQNLYYPVLYSIIITVGFILLLFALIIIYRKYYKITINQLLQEENKSKFLLSPYIIIIGLILVVIASGIFTNEFIKTKYHENHFSNIYVSATTSAEWELDWENITISRLDVRVNGEELATYMNVTNRIEITTFLDYSIIKESVDNIILEKQDEPICMEDFGCIYYGEWAEIELYLTDGSTTFSFSIQKYDEYTYFIYFSRTSGSRLMAFTIDEDSPYLSDIKKIHDEIEDVLAIYMANND